MGSPSVVGRGLAPAVFKENYIVFARTVGDAGPYNGGAAAYTSGTPKAHCIRFGEPCSPHPPRAQRPRSPFPKGKANNVASLP